MSRYTPLDADLYNIPKAQLLGGRWVNGLPPKRLKYLCDCEDIELEYESEETEIIGNDDLVQVVRKVIQTKRSGTVKFGARQFTELLKTAGLMATEKEVDIAAAAEKVIADIKNIEVGDIFETEIPDAQAAELVVGAVTFVKGTHLSIVDNGDIEVIKLPDGYAAIADTAGTLTVTGPAAASKVTERALLATDGELMRIKIVQLHKGGSTFVIPKLRIKPDGSLTLATMGTDVTPQTFTGKIEKDLLEPVDRRMGYATANRRASDEPIPQDAPEEPEEPEDP